MRKFFFDLMYEFFFIGGQKKWQLGFSKRYTVLAKNNWMSDDWKNQQEKYRSRYWEYGH